MNINIKLKSAKLTIESDLPKKETIEKLLIGMVLYYRDKEPERLDGVVSLINAIYEQALQRDPQKRRRASYKL